MVQQNFAAPDRRGVGRAQLENAREIPCESPVRAFRKGRSA